MVSHKTHRKAVKVYCTNLKKEFSSIKSAASFAHANQWTMSVKMGTAGCFIDHEGNEYVRQTPLLSKNKYKNTGPVTQRIVTKYTKKKNGKQEKFSFITDREDYTPSGNPMEINIDKLIEEAQNIVPTIKDKVLNMLEEEKITLLKSANIYDEFVEIETMIKKIQEA